MRAKCFFLFIIASLIVSYLHIKQIELNTSVEDTLDCYLEALPNLSEINQCSAAILEKEIEIIKSFKVK